MKMYHARSSLLMVVCLTEALYSTVWMTTPMCLLCELYLWCLYDSGRLQALSTREQAKVIVSIEMFVISHRLFLQASLSLSSGKERSSNVGNCGQAVSFKTSCYCCGCCYSVFSLLLTLYNSMVFFFQVKWIYCHLNHIQ